MYRWIVRALVVLIVLSAGMLAWGEPAREAADPDGIAVVATTNIVGDVVAAVGGDRLSLYVMLPQGADPHAFQPTPRDARQVADADVVFINGAGLEVDFLGDLIASVAPRLLVDLSAHLPLRRVRDADDGHGDEHGHEDEDHDDEDGHHADEDEDDHDHDEEGHHDEDEDDHDHDEEGHHDEDEDDHDHDEEGHHDEDEDHHDDDHGEGEGGHDHGEFDPHVWMDPTLVAVWATEIAEVLAEVDPSHGAEYARRADTLVGELDELDAWIRDRVAAVPRDRRILVTDHDVFGYFADRYGFTVLDTIIPGFSTVSEPSARHLARLREAIAEHSVPAIFVGLTVNPQVARVVADDLGIEVISVYTGSLSEPDGPAATYREFMRTNVERIVAALSR